MSRRLGFGRFLLAALVCFVALAGVRPAAAAQEQALIGIYLSEIQNLDFATGKFAADFSIWSVTGESGHSSVETGRVVDEADKSSDSTHTDVKDGKRWDRRRIRSNIWSDWDVTRFPFDHQTVNIVIEESFETIDTFKYVVDRANSGINPRMQIPGWKILGWEIGTRDQAYPSNFGDPTRPAGSTFSQLVLSVTMQRDGLTIFIDATIGAFVAFGVLVLSFRLLPIVPPIFGARMVIIVGSMFTVMTSMRVYGASFAVAFGETLPTRIHLVTLAAGFLAGLGAVMARYWVEKGDEAFALRWDRGCMLVFSVLYVAIVAADTMHAILLH